ncbi:hypothetical protein B0H11DRAFT_1865665 [Mycena galericulata]|nr:hypothetical protein B0H11DRAFT_1865665 [Mycena galericulata]
MATVDPGEPSFKPGEVGGLTSADTYWRDLQPWLEERGFRLRPRFRQGWTPSWRLTGGVAILAEDSYSPLRHQIVDAVRIRDGALVILKKVKKDNHPLEVDIHTFLSSEPLINDPKNHCIPLLEVLEPPSIPGTQLLVMKLLRDYEDPYFDTIGEAVDFFRQIFEGIQFMHKHLVVHRDCCSGNIMLDGQHLYPNGFHPQFQEISANFVGKAKHLTRTQAPPKYYLIDFGISIHFSPNSPRLAMPTRGGDRSAPEFDGDGAEELLDPFPTDIYYLGNLIRNEFLDGQHNPEYVLYNGRVGFEFMRPLVDAMTKRDPKERPKIDEVVDRFEEIVSGLSTWKLRSRVRGKEEYAILSLPRIARHWYRRIGFMIKGVPAIPSYHS